MASISNKWEHNLPIIDHIPERFTIIVKDKKEYFELINLLETFGYRWNSELMSNIDMWNILKNRSCIYLNVYKDGFLTYGKPLNLFLVKLNEVKYYIRQVK